MISSSVTLVRKGRLARFRTPIVVLRGCPPDCHIRGTRHLAVMHILRRQITPAAGPACGVRRDGVRTPSQRHPAAITTRHATVSASVTVTAAAKIWLGVATAAGG